MDDFIPFGMLDATGFGLKFDPCVCVALQFGRDHSPRVATAATQKLCEHLTV